MSEPPDERDQNRTAADRIAALNARRPPGAPRAHPARGARRVTLLASVVAVAGLTGGFALNTAAESSATVAATKAVATTNTTTAAATASTSASTTASTTADTTASTTQNTTAQAVTTSQGS